MSRAVQTNTTEWCVEVRVPDSRVRAEFIESHLDLVRHVALRVSARLPRGIDVDDLSHDGVIGLLDAVDKYDPERAVRFRTYAEARIRGAILDGMRQRDWTPRSVRQLQRRLDSVLAGFSTRRSTVGEEEIAGALGLDMPSYHTMLRESAVGNLLALDDVPQRCEPVTDEHEQPDRPIERRELIDALAEELERLPQRELKVLELYYHDRLNMKEVGAILGVTESRVCQLHALAAGRLRVALQERSQPDPQANLALTAAR